MNSQTTYIKVLKTSPWVQYHPEDLPARIVMWQPDDTKARQTMQTEAQYATHLETQTEDGTLSFNWGHYDMTREAALADFFRRQSRLTEEARRNIYQEPRTNKVYFDYIAMQSEQRGIKE